MQSVQLPNGVMIDETLEGPSAELLLHSGSDPGPLRPFVGADGRSQIVRNLHGPVWNAGRPPHVLTSNAPATLPYDAYKLFDNVMVDAAKTEMRLSKDLIDAGLTYNIPDGFSVMSVQHRTRVAPYPQTAISMEGLRRADRERPLYDYAQIPLPMIHVDNSFPSRELAAFRRANLPLDTTMFAEGGASIMDTVEKLILGVLPAYSYANGTIYGYANYPGRNTTTIRSPATYSGWTPVMTINDMMAIIQILRLQEFSGPYRWYFGRAWIPYMGNDYINGSNGFTGESLMSRIQKIPEVGTVSIANYLQGFRVLCINMRPNTVQLITGMPLSLMRWQGEAGMAQYWKQAIIMVPRIRSDAIGRCGIVDAAPTPS